MVSYWARIKMTVNGDFQHLIRFQLDFKNFIKYFEDEYFDYHFGVNPISFVRAIKQNIKHGRIVSGASTLTINNSYV